MRKILITYFFVIVTLLCACNNDGSKESGLALVKTTNPAPLSLEKSTKKELDLIGAIEQDVESFKELYDVSVLKGKEDILVAYKVRHMQRFHMKKIEKKIKKLLEDKYSQENFIVSSDYKIFLEAVKLEEKLKDPTYSTEKAEKRLQEIIKLKKELT
ncbi:sporulation protein [Robertmurraya sp. DFI.2.37]|uniref:sporulation protein n=1 Tax=Robertmurraya sp. DFI.2.37 TaxID=3031819 RepID=UPI001245A98A|nr:sporulation protein [Robertmurraya sp. DFI.2.37]MDF1507472.1 sporulation protein [Robertmurraya sp. DFI.2.37]